MEVLKPKQIVEELDKFIIGQQEAKRAVAIALRNRYRRSRLSAELRDEITPKNIIMKGPTGVGKTEIARRLAKLVGAPFIKVEATKFTEVGYVGRDVESMIRDLVEAAIRLVKEEKFNEVRPMATETAVKRMVDIIFQIRRQTSDESISNAELKEKILEELKQGKYDSLVVPIEITDNRPKTIQLGSVNNEINIGDIMSGLTGRTVRKKVRKMSVKDGLRMLIDEVSDSLIDHDAINVEALRRAEQEGIIFLDELDKITTKGTSHGPDVSREGVQRDILPIVEGCTVTTKHGTIKTDFILFIAAGAFHMSEVRDLIPELQGRFPIRVELKSLTEKDFVRIMTEPQNAILKLYAELLKVDNVNIKFTDEAVKEIAGIVAAENENSEDIGARRLHSVIERLLDDISYEGGNEDEYTEIIIDKQYVIKHFENALREMNLKKYIL
ncbi:MAG: ATP-dependent protease ATPase subunit HslU [Christensenellales bacterium]|jgi:ATP-dependent HslUV protease ATP-binding subunit HslU